MTTLPRPRPHLVDCWPEPSDRGASVEIVVPVYNEEKVLAASIRRLHDYVGDNLTVPTVITVADNASTDGTVRVAERLMTELPGVRVLAIPRKGRGLALHTAWDVSRATVVAYMDVDLSTDLAALAPLIAPVLSGHSEVAIGSRLTRGSRVRRGLRREVISRGYNKILQVVLRLQVSDSQCGFKALTAPAWSTLSALVEDPAWFFDTELLVVAERSGMRIHEVPVDWVDDPDSRVDITTTALADLAGIRRLWWGLHAGALRHRLTDARQRTAAVRPTHCGTAARPTQAA